MYKRETHKLVKKSLIMCMYSQHDSLLESNYQTQSIRIWLANLIFLLAKQFFHSQWLLKYQPLSGLKYGNETWNCYMYSTLIIVVSGHVNLELYASVFTKPLLYRFSSSEQSDSKIRMYGLNGIRMACWNTGRMFCIVRQACELCTYCHVYVQFVQFMTTLRTVYLLLDVPQYIYCVYTLYLYKYTCTCIQTVQLLT